MRTKKTPLMIETERLARSQETAALALASGCTEDEAAKKIGAASRTIKTWLQTDHTFTHRIHQIRSSISQRVNASLVDKMQTAIATLEDLCRDSRNDATRLAAAKQIIELGMKMQENVEFKERITVCEVSQRQDHLHNESTLRIQSETTKETLNVN